MRGCTYRLSRWIALPPSQRETLPIRAPLMTIFALLLEMLGLPVRHTLPVDDLEVLRITLTLLVGRCLRRAGSARQHGRCEKEGHQYHQGPPPRISYEYHPHLPSAHRLALPYCANAKAGCYTQDLHDWISFGSKVSSAYRRGCENR